MDNSFHYVEVCDIPYCSEPDLFYRQRMKVGMSVRELREAACRLFGKRGDELTLRDLKLAFLRMYHLQVNLGGEDHKVTVTKLHGQWILSCDCPSWIFNLSGDRSCRHTDYVEGLISREEEKWRASK